MNGNMLTNDHRYKYKHCKKKSSNNVDVEIAVVSTTYTVIDPWTMVVKLFHAPITNITMSATWLSYHFTKRTKRTLLKLF